MSRETKQERKDGGARELSFGGEEDGGVPGCGAGKEVRGKGLGKKQEGREREERETYFGPITQKNYDEEEVRIETRWTEKNE
jgi:hypothetical protein